MKGVGKASTSKFKLDLRGCLFFWFFIESNLFLEFKMFVFRIYYVCFQNLRCLFFLVFYNLL